MPTLEHHGLIELFRENSALAPHLLGLLFHLDVPAHSSIRVADSELDQMIPVEFRADLVVELRDDRGDVVFAIVLKVQRDKDARKKFLVACLRHRGAGRARMSGGGARRHCRR